MSDHGNIDLSFTFSPIYDDYSVAAVRLLTDITALPIHALTGTSEEISIDISVEDVGLDKFIVIQTILDVTTIDQSNYKLGSFNDIILNIRIFFYDQYVSVYCNDCCVYSYVFDTIIYNELPALTLKSFGDNMVITNICLRELPDYREAVFVDYEATTESAIQSIIQQRPIEINPEVDRKLNFTYDATKDNVNAHNMKSYEDLLQDNLQMSSDGIVYYEDVGVAVNTDTAEQVGFITRMYRLSELTTGAISGAKKNQRSALQKRHSISVELGRIDPRIEVRDILNINTVVTGTQRNVIDSIIVEDVNIRLSDGEFSTSITGRKNG